MTITAQVSRRIPAGRDKVFETLTSKEGMKAYMMGAEVETDWTPGHPIVMRGEFGGKAFEDRGEVRSFEPGRSFSYTHQSSGKGPVHLVTVKAEPVGQETVVTITQANADGSVSEADLEHRGVYEKTWAKMLEGVEKAVGAN